MLPRRAAILGEGQAQDVYQPVIDGLAVTRPEPLPGRILRAHESIERIQVARLLCTTDSELEC